MRRCLFVTFVVIGIGIASHPGALAQSQLSSSAGESRPKASRPARADGSLPAGRYSPMAAQGGYSNRDQSPLAALVHALNPRDIDFGAVWEERRRAWLENAGANRYFWYSFALTAVLVLSWLALAWAHTDRIRERWQLAEHAADALRYAEYCKRRATEAIGRYNDHVEKCNRVVEAEESGIVTPEAANLEDYRREIQRLKSDNDAKDLRVARLEEQLEQKGTQLTSLTERVGEAERRLRNRPAAAQEQGNSALVERIQRLESENRRLKQGRSSTARAADATGPDDGDN